MSSIDKLNWESLEFTCTTEMSPTLDPEADAWYREARNLQKLNEDRHILAIVGLYEKAIARNHYNAMHRLALLYVEGAEGLKPDERKAVELIERVIKLNVASGYYQMGVFLEQGIGVKQDRAASLTYMRKAADMGNPLGQFVSGKRILEAAAQAPDKERGFSIGVAMLSCALNQGNADAGYRLAHHYASRDATKALEAFQHAARLGHHQSLYELHLIFADGEYGVAKDAARAACYKQLSDETSEDKSKRYPGLDRICPLPPKPMP